MLRPEHLKTARAEHAAGKLSTHEFKRLEDGAVDDAIAIQERAGLDVVTDGEMRRSSFIGPLASVQDCEGHPAEPADARAHMVAEVFGGRVLRSLRLLRRRGANHHRG